MSLSITEEPSASDQLCTAPVTPGRGGSSPQHFGSGGCSEHKWVFGRHVGTRGSQAKPFPGGCGDAAAQVGGCTQAALFAAWGWQPGCLSNHPAGTELLWSWRRFLGKPWGAGGGLPSPPWEQHPASPVASPDGGCCMSEFQKFPRTPHLASSPTLPLLPPGFWDQVSPHVPHSKLSHGGHVPAVGSPRANAPKFPFLAPHEPDHLTNESRGEGLMRRTKSKHHRSEPRASQELQRSLDKGKKEPAHTALGWLSLKLLTWLGWFSPSPRPGGDGAASARCSHGPELRGWGMEGALGQGAWRVSGADVSPSCCVG